MDPQPDQRVECLQSCDCCAADVSAEDPGEFYQPSTRCGVCGHPGSDHAGAPRRPLSFGDRLREEIVRARRDGYNNGSLLLNILHAERLADAIDADRDSYRRYLLALCADQEAEHFANLRVKISKAVSGIVWEDAASEAGVMMSRIRLLLEEIFGEAGRPEVGHG